MQVDGTGARTIWLGKNDAIATEGGDYVFYLKQPIFNHNVDPNLPSSALRMRIAQCTIVDDVDYTGDQFAFFIPELNVSSTLTGLDIGVPLNPIFVGIARNAQDNGATIINDVGYDQMSEYRDVYTQSQIQQLTLNIYTRTPATKTWTRVTDLTDFLIELSFS